MSRNLLREDQLFDELRVGLHDVDSLRKKARDAIQGKLFEKAGIIFAAMAKQAPSDPDLALQAARCYEKAEGAREDTMRWFLASSERYSRQNYPTKAIAILRLYHKMAPDEHEGPRRIFRLCRDMDDFSERLLEFLSPKERAGHHWRSQDIFTTFDDQTFDDMLEAMELHYLKSGETLIQKDDEASSLFVVVDGCLDGYLTLNGERTKIGSIHPGEICGEIGYFLGGKRTAEVVAGDASTVLELPYSKLDDLREKAPDFGDRLDHLYQSRMLANQLAVNDFFSELSTPLRNEITHRMRPVSLRAGEMLFDAVDTTKDLYVIQSGEISVHLKLGEGKHLKDVSAGSLIGEFSVALGGKRTAIARAISDCKLMQLPGDDYQELYEAHQELRDLLAKRKTRYMAETRDFIMNMDEDISEHVCTSMLRLIWGASDT